MAADQESPGLSYNALGVLFLIVFAPFVAAVGAALGALVSLCGVIPLLVTAGSLGRARSGREAWGWVPVVAAAGTGLPALVTTVLLDADPLTGAGGWIAVTSALVPPALVARRLLLPHRRRLSGRAMFGRVALHGTLAVVAACGLAVVGFLAGIAYEPPRLSTEQVAGTWSDGKGGTLSLTAEGAAMATRVETYEMGDSFDPVVRECTGTGTWGYDPGAGPWAQQVTVTIDDCPMDTWEVYGSSEHPKLFVFIGDPDSGDLYILRREGREAPRDR